MKDLHLGVVVPVLNAFPEFAKCIASVKSELAWWQPYVGKQWEENLAIAAVWNRKSRAAFLDGCDYVLILNDDAYVEPWAVDRMIEELQQNPSLHLVSGESTHMPGEVIQAEPLKRANLNFSCFMITPELFNWVGLFDENFYPAYFEDNDFHYRMQLLGMPAYGLKAAQFFHQGSVTTNNRKEEIGHTIYSQFEDNRTYYVEKWGGNPGEEVFSHPFNEPAYGPEYWELKK